MSIDSCAAPPDPTRQIDPHTVEQAAMWIAKLQSGLATEMDEATCLRWRQAHPDHECAWQRMQALVQGIRTGSQGLAPELVRTTLRRVGKSRRFTLKSAAGAIIMGWGAWAAYEQLPWRRWGADERTGIGELRAIKLTDGTEVVLGTSTAIDIRFTAQQRQLVLQSGDIMVTTAQDTMRRPFRVVTESGSIVPIGTKFLVRHEPQGTTPNVTYVSVTQGAVDIRARLNAAALRLVAGQQTRFSNSEVEPAGVLVPADIAWTQGMLVAERMRLADFLAELDRYRAGKLRCDPAVAELRVSGAFLLNNPQAVLDLIEETLPVRVSYLAGYWATVGPK